VSSYLVSHPALNIRLIVEADSEEKAIKKFQETFPNITENLTVEIYNPEPFKYTPPEKTDITKSLEEVKAKRERLAGPSIEEIVNVPRIPDLIEQRAREIINQGRVLEHFQDTCALLHIGDSGLLQLNYLALFSTVSTGFQLHIYAIGTSGKGKSHAAEIATLCMPDSRVERLTSLSGKALMYLENPDRWDKKIIFIDEFQASDNSTDIIKALTSNSRTKPRHLAVDNDPITKRRITRDLEFKGKVAILLTSVRPLENEELLNRFVIANVDENPNIDKQVFRLQKERFSEGKEKATELPIDFEVQKRVTEIILGDGQNFEVVIPFGDRIESMDIENRRNLNTFLTIMKTITIVNRFQRKSVKLDDRTIQLEATVEDFHNALDIWSQVCETSKSHVCAKALEVMRILSDKEEEAITRSQISDLTGFSMTSIIDYVGQLYRAGLVSWKISPEYGKTYLYWRIENIDAATLGFYLRPDPTDPAEMRMQGSIEPPCNTEVNNQSLSTLHLNENIYRGFEVQSSSSHSSAIPQGGQSEPIYTSSGQIEPQKPYGLENVGSHRAAESVTGTQPNLNSNSEWKGLKRPPIYSEEGVVELERNEVEDGEIMGKGDI